MYFRKKFVSVIMLVIFLQFIPTKSTFALTVTETDTIAATKVTSYNTSIEKEIEEPKILVEDREAELGFENPENKHQYSVVQNQKTANYLQLIYDRILNFYWNNTTTTPEFYVDPNNTNCYFIEHVGGGVNICAWYNSDLKKLYLYEKSGGDVYKIPYYYNSKLNEILNDDGYSYQDILDIAWYYLDRKRGEPSIYLLERGSDGTGKSPPNIFTIYRMAYPELQPWEGTEGLFTITKKYIFDGVKMNIYEEERIQYNVPDKYVCDVDMQEVKTAVENHNKTYLTEEQLLDIAKKYIKAMPNSTAHVETDWVNYNCAFIIMTPTGSEEEIANTKLPLSQRRVYWWNGDTRELYESDPVAPCPDKKAVKFVAKVHGYLPPDERPLKSWEK